MDGAATVFRTRLSEAEQLPDRAIRRDAGARAPVEAVTRGPLGARTCVRGSFKDVLWIKGGCTFLATPPF